MQKTVLQRLYEEQGQAPWLDSISRAMIASGELARLIAEVGIVGVTSNPTIFAQAITRGSVYQDPIRQLQAQGLAPTADLLGADVTRYRRGGGPAPAGL